MKTLVTPALWTPLRAGRLSLRNRLVLPPMASETGTAAGHVTEATLRHYGRIVSERHALAFVEYTYVHPWGRSEPHQLGISDETHLAGLRELATLIRSKGAVAGLQLTHAGGKTEADLIGRQPLGASGIAVPVLKEPLPPPQAMTADEIEILFQAFVRSALQAEAIGFKVIEIHCAHGYFFNQWLSPITNQRPDLHGGSLANRAGLLLRLLRTLRRQLRPETVISLRFPAQDRLEGGLTLTDGQTLAQWAQAAGVDVLNVSSGLGGWRRGRAQRGEGYLVPDAAAIRKAVDLPVIGVGGIETPAYIEATLGRGDVDLVAVGRAVLADPTWPEAA